MTGRIAQDGGDVLVRKEQGGRDGPPDPSGSAEDSDIHGRDGRRAAPGNRNVTTYRGRVTSTDAPLPRFDPACPDSTFPIRIGGRWTSMIVLCLHTGPRRFGVLRRQLRPISAKVLAESLSAMERDGLVHRSDAEYELTPLGASLLDIIEHTRAWARQHLDELAQARAEFDALSPSARR
jgi:DNA-binding HxlR family transcriptional regulator